jgi:hypothetical protein
MKVDVVSTFSPSYYQRVAKFFVESSIKFLQESVKLKLYVDDFDFPKGKNFEILDLEKTVPALADFKKRNADRPQDDWRHAATVFSHKVYATCHAAKNTDADILIWLDADAEFTNKVDEVYLSKFIKKGIDIGYLGRKRSTETGFIVFDLKSPNTHNFLNEYQKIYDTDKLFEHKEWHDGYIFDRVREELEGKDVLNTQNISPTGTKKSHFNNLHKGYITHHKGDDKEKRNAI